MSERGAELTRIALEHGSCSHSHFIAAFRRYFGITFAGGQPVDFAGSVDATYEEE